MSTREAELLRAACCVAGLDGEVSDDEMKLLRKLQDNAGVGEASFKAMVDRALSDSNYFEDVLEHLRSDAQSVMETLVRVAKTDSDVTLNERAILTHLGQRIGLDDERINQLLDE